MSVQDTVVIQFGDSVDTDNVIARVDPDPNYEEQNKDLFIDTVANYFLHMQDDLYIDRIEMTSGDYRLIQAQTRSIKEKRVYFPTLETVNSLDFIPSTPLEVTWFGQNANLTLSNKNEIRADSVPCIGDIKYSYKGIQIQIYPDTNAITVDEEGQWPIGMVIHLEQS